MHDASFRIDRRSFVVGSALVAVSAGLPSFALAAEQAPRHLLVDRRFLAHRSRADRTLPQTHFDGNLTQPWVDHLQPLLREHASVVEGIVSPAALFCLEQLVQGERHRIVSTAALEGTDAIRFRIAPVGARGIA